MAKIKKDKDDIKYAKLPTSPNNIQEARIFETYTNEDGREVERPWKDLKIVEASFAYNIVHCKENKNRKFRFFCPVRDSKDPNKICNAELFLFSKGEKVCFKTVEGSFHTHTFANKIHDISNTVIFNPRTFLEKQLIPKKRKNKNEPITVYEDIADVPFEPPEIIQPTNLSEFYFQTRTKNMLDYFPNQKGDYHHKYCEGLVNKETITNFRSGLYQFGIPILAIGEIPNKKEDEIAQYLLKYNSLEEKTTIVLRDPFPVSETSENKERLYFILFADRNPCKEGKKYLILCDWEGSLLLKLSIPTKKDKKSIEVRVVKGDISKASSQIQNLDDGLFDRMETIQYFKPNPLNTDQDD